MALQHRLGCDRRVRREPVFRVFEPAIYTPRLTDKAQAHQHPTGIERFDSRHGTITVCYSAVLPVW